MRLLALSAALAALAPLARAQWPPGFASTPVASGWDQPTGLVYAADGRLLVWEKAGRVWQVVNGVKSAAPLIDIAEEVGNWRDHGLLGFALDPAFLQNGRVYLLYVVDYHHLRWFGTPSYDPNSNQYFRDTIGRITRFTLDLNAQPPTVVPGSRAVLVGESMSTGIPICNQSHGVGSLVFGSDGTLLASTGDSASYDAVDTGGNAPGSSNTALAEGILRAKEDVGAFRAQLVDGLNGKILRIDPATGDGVAGNPFYAAAAPRSPRSRVWALGLRNPFRFGREAGSGSADPAAANPGRLWIGDVGWSSWEELDRCVKPGQNFGWPLYEGLEAHPQYAAQTTVNLDAPNPLSGAGGCAQPFLPFRSLLVQDVQGTPSWPNPCDPAQQIPASIPRFVHARGVLDWFHGSGPARAPVFQGGAAAVVPIGAPGAPIQGPQFGGSSSTGGTWYGGTDFPPAYRDAYYFADYAAGWIRQVVVDGRAVPTDVLPFGQGGEVSGVVALATDPVQGGLTFIRYSETGGPIEIRRVFHTPNLPPVAVAQPGASHGPVPLQVQFSSAGSSDPENQPLTFSWDFGDGTTSTLADPVHVYDALADVTAAGTIIARVFELNPPHPTGGGSWNPETIRDGDTPPAGSNDSARQYDTFHSGAQGDFDWIGYAFPAPRTFRALQFQEGIHFFDGGWFDQVRVEVGNGASWTPVAGLVVAPQYPGNNGISYETFRFDFAPATGTHIRIAGAPGGSADFISVGELRVWAEDPVLLTQPARRDVTLTVRDPLGGTATATVLVSLNNTPPQVTITSPVHGSTYSLGGPASIPLTANIVDAEHAPGQLACAWQTILHHNTHSHPEPIDASCATTTLITPEGCDGDAFAFEIVLTVTDAAGLATTARSWIHPDCVPVRICPGDGSGTACPCGNPGATGRGCENSFTTGGGSLSASGSARVTADTAALAAAGLPPAATVLFFQGDALVAGGLGAPFGDGLRCVAGSVVRLGVRTAAGGAAALGPAAGDAPLSVLGGLPPEGGVRNYQCWYRNSAAFCTSALFNLSNAVRITWIP